MGNLILIVLLIYLLYILRPNYTKPPSRSSPANFSERADAFIVNLDKFVDEVKSRTNA